MENQNDLAELLFERLKEFAKTSYELIKLKTLDKLVRFLSVFISNVFVILFLSVFFLFLNIGLAIWFGQIFGEMYLGFFCMAGIYGITGGVLFFLCKNWMRRKFADSLVNNILN